MGRMTRAKAAELSNALHVDEDEVEVLRQPHTSSSDSPPIVQAARPPLGDIAPNRVGITTDHKTDSPMVADQNQSRKGIGRKATKSSDQTTPTNDLGASTDTHSQRLPVILPDNHDLPPSPASQSASEDLMTDVPELGEPRVLNHDIMPAAPSSDAVRSTRNQLRKVPSDLSIESSNVTTLPNQPAVVEFNSDQQSGVNLVAANEPIKTPKPFNHSSPTCGLDEAACDLQQPIGESVNRFDSTFADDKALSTIVESEQTDEAMNVTPVDGATAYDELEAAAIEAQTPPRSSRSSSATTAPTSVSDGASESQELTLGNTLASPSKLSCKKPGPVVRTTKASQARISIAHGPKERPQFPSLGRPTTQNAATSKRITSTSSNSSTKSEDAVEKKEIVIPHSKPRPMSMAFPAPPPPPKSTKAPTQSNFQLPGEAIAAKLKAAKEARVQKEAEEQKKKVFKARPVPASHTKGAAVRQTSTSMARESMMTATKPTTAPAHQRASSAASSAATSLPTSSNASSAQNTTTAPSRAKATSRPSTAMALSSMSTTGPKPRAPSAAAVRPASTVPGASRTLGTTKGKEVYNRTVQAQEVADREKREKEEAAKKARSEAAERSRLASREWAEKQRVRKLVAKMEGKLVDETMPSAMAATAEV